MTDEMEFTEETGEIEPCECQADINELKDELDNLRNRISLLTKDNAELITDNLALRAKTEALLEARAALPEFSIPTEIHSDKYAGVREAFKNANTFFKRK
ncbi:MAG: hypothetical protein LBC82_08935 [Oscillospiraceae bacterium]|jgi:hypothetical protein|nr:hypothetical protein [Oscillospiraceae bacterium]